MKQEFSKVSSRSVAVGVALMAALAGGLMFGKIEGVAGKELAQVRNRVPTAELTIGERMPDGTVYAGESPDSGKRLFAAAAGAPTAMTFNEAAAYARNLDAHGHKDWRLPSRNELKMMFDSRAAIGGFAAVPDSGRTPWYWSCTEHRDLPSYVWTTDFTGRLDGWARWVRKDIISLSSRAVRAEP